MIETNRCKAINSRGEPCRSTSIRPSGLCAFHDGSTPLGTAEGARHAAQRSAASRRAKAARRHATVRDALAARTEELADKILAAYEAGLDAEDPAVRVRSADVLMSRVFGKPKETVETVLDTPEDLKAIREMSAAERDALYRQLLAEEMADVEQHGAA